VEFSPWYFAHNLAKGPYQKFKLLPANIILMTPTEHMFFDQQTDKAKLDPRFEWVFLQRQILKQKYYETGPKNETAN
jgi:hypothetical protein